MPWQGATGVGLMGAHLFTLRRVPGFRVQRRQGEPDRGSEPVKPRELSDDSGRGSVTEGGCQTTGIACDATMHRL
jgi:hypothetical protein